MGKALLRMLQTTGDPGAVGLLVVAGLGVVCCFLGTRYFRLSVAVAGFLVGAELVGRFALSQGAGGVVCTLVGVLGGAALATFFVFFPVPAVFALGAMLSATLMSLSARAADAPLSVLPLLLAMLIGGFGALMLKRPVAVVSTALYGAVMAMSGAFMLLKGRGVRDALDAATALRGLDDVALFLLCVVVLVTGGVVVQFRYGGRSVLDGK